jgi:hypothetical protein
LSAITQPSTGATTQTATVTYTPTSYARADSFTFKATSGETDSPTKTVTLTPYLNFILVTIN